MKRTRPQASIVGVEERQTPTIEMGKQEPVVVARVWPTSEKQGEKTAWLAKDCSTVRLQTVMIVIVKARRATVRSTNLPTGRNWKSCRNLPR